MGTPKRGTGGPLGAADRRARPGPRRARGRSHSLRDALADPGTAALVDRLPDWEGGLPLSGHESPSFAPNLLGLLADMGLRVGDDARVDRLLEQMLAHQDAEGRFTSFAPPRDGRRPVWGSLLCDTHAIIEVLVRFGFGADPRVRAGLDRMAADLTAPTRAAPGRAARTRPPGSAGPGARNDFCPMVTLEALRTFALLPADQQPADLVDTARVALAAWTNRATSKPYMFGHGVSVQDSQVASVLVPGGRGARRPGPLPGTLGGNRSGSR